MAVHRLFHRQLIPADLATVWAFFSAAGNLAAITPEYMRFRVTSADLPEHIYPGMIITYKVSPLLGVPLFWMTEIRHVVPERLFVDEQRRGPYRLWHHQHHFEAVAEGVLMTDIIHYELPLGLLGELVRVLAVRARLDGIFAYRRQQIASLFPS